MSHRCRTCWPELSGVNFYRREQLGRGARRGRSCGSVSAFRSVRPAAENSLKAIFATLNLHRVHYLTDRRFVRAEGCDVRDGRLRLKKIRLIDPYFDTIDKR